MQGNANGETFLARPKISQNKGTSSKIVHNFKPNYPKGKCIYICTSSPLFWNYDQIELVPDSFGKFGIVEKMESRQFGRNLTSGIFFYHSHKALTNRFLRVNSEQPKTTVMANVYLPVSLSSSLQLKRDTLTAHSFFQIGEQG